MKAVSSVIILGIGLLMVSGSPARAQFGEMGEAVKKGASDAAKQEMMKQAGLPTPGTPAVTPSAVTGGTTTPAGEAKVTPGAADTPAATAGADTGAATTPGGEAKVTPEDTGAGAATPPAGEPKVAPGAAATPAGLEGAAGTMMQEQMKKKIPKLP